MSQWKDIWNSREMHVQRYLLEALIKADGYDTASGQISVDSWLESAKNIIERLEIKDKPTSIYEIGCGSGALLYAMQMQVPSIVGGGGGQTIRSHLSNLRARF